MLSFEGVPRAHQYDLARKFEVLPTTGPPQAATDASESITNVKPKGSSRFGSTVAKVKKSAGRNWCEKATRPQKGKLNVASTEPQSPPTGGVCQDVGTSEILILQPN